MTLPAAPLTDRQADAEAKRLFGELGVAWHHACAGKGDLRYCQIGTMVDPETGEVEFTQEKWTVLGRGATWEEAFRMARRRKN